MTLVDLTRGLFTYLVRFRSMAGQPQAPSLERARRELESRFEEMADQVRRQPHLRAPYEMVVQALADLADEVVIDSDWEHAGAWAAEPLRLRLFGQDGDGRGFFERLAGFKKPPPDVLAIHYLCLALGFHGPFAPGDPDLARIKVELLARLPSRPSLEPSPPAGPAPAVAPPRRDIVPLVAREARPLERPRDRAPNPWSEKANLRHRRAWGLAALGLALLGAAWLGLGQVTATRKTGPTPAAPPPAAEPAAALAPAPSPAAKADAPPVSRPQPAPAPAPAPVAVAERLASPEGAAPSAPAPPSAAPGGESSPAAAPPTPAAAPAGEGYAVQAGLFVGPLQSGRLAEGIRRLGYPALVLEREMGGKPRFLVLAGPFEEREAALASLEPLRRQLGIQPYLTDLRDPGKRLP